MGDEVVVTTGVYSVTSNLLAPASDVYIHGDFSNTMPRIETSTAGAPIAFAGAGGRLRYMELVNAGATRPLGVSCGPDGKIDLVRATAIGDYATAAAVSGNGCSVSNSLLRADGSDAIALSAFGAQGETATARNVTAVATGNGSTGIVSAYNAVVPGFFLLDLGNVIASGGEADLLATDAVGQGNITISHSNFDRSVPQGSAKISGFYNQTAAPVFVNAAGGDYREAPGSPTIDAGDWNVTGLLALDGNPRRLGYAPDIGAYEFMPPELPQPPPPRLNWLRIQPRAFRPANFPSAILSRTSGPQRNKVQVRRGATVRYSLTAAITVHFFVQRKLSGRKVNGNCRKPTRVNRKRRKCAYWRQYRHRFRHRGSAGVNQFVFSGRLGRRKLPLGSYRLIARSPDSARQAYFKIVR